jgi:hypothetical protein
MSRLFGSMLLLAVALSAARAQPPRPTWEHLEKRASGLLPTKAQLRYQEIPWVHDLAAAQTIAQAEHRPIFLWGYGGRGRPDNGLEGC